jgi:hypothetical protein
VPFKGRVSPERGNKNNLQVAPVSSDASGGPRTILFYGPLR